MIVHSAGQFCNLFMFLVLNFLASSNDISTTHQSGEIGIASDQIESLISSYTIIIQIMSLQSKKPLKVKFHTNKLKFDGCWWKINSNYGKLQTVAESL